MLELQVGAAVEAAIAAATWCFNRYCSRRRKLLLVLESLRSALQLLLQLALQLLLETLESKLQLLLQLPVPLKSVVATTLVPLSVVGRGAVVAVRAVGAAVVGAAIAGAVEVGIGNDVGQRFS